MIVGNHSREPGHHGRVCWVTSTDHRREGSPGDPGSLSADTCDSQVVITRGPNPCLEIYPAHEFKRIADQIEAMEDRDMADLLNARLIGSAHETEIDKQGRVLLPPMLRKYSKLDGSAVLMGQIRRFDLWPEELWNERFGEDASGYATSLKTAFRTLKR